jgi:hypothetical protein
MVNLHHKPLKKFSLDGSIHDDSAMWRLKLEYINLIITQMRMSGYIPRVDISPDFTVEYNQYKDCFEFELSLYGIYVGKRKSEWIFGVDGQTAILIQQNRSSEYSSEAV